MPTPTNQFRLKLQPATAYNFSIDWGDGFREIFAGTTSPTDNDAGITHTYSIAGPKIINITENVVGGFPKPYYDGFRNTASNNDDTKVKKILQWGRGTFSDLAYSFAGCTNLTINATDHGTSKLNLVTNLNSAWYNCTSLTSFPVIDTSNVTNFNATWFGCSNITNFPLLNMNKMRDGTNCFNGVRLPTDVYSQLLQNLANNNFNFDVVFHAGSQTTYNPTAQQFRDILTNQRRWIITDGGSRNSLNFSKIGGTQAQRDNFNFFTNPTRLTCGVGCNSTSVTFGPSELVTLDYNSPSNTTCSRPNIFYRTSRAVEYTYVAGDGINMIGNGILNTGNLIVFDSSLIVGGTPSDGTPYQETASISIIYKEIKFLMSSAIDVQAEVRCSSP